MSLVKMIAGSAAGWNVCGEAENGREAERMIADMQPDLVITDIRMPLMDGLELLKRVKAEYPEIEFIVVTGYQDFQYAQAALRSGALDLLVKPCSKQDIDDALRKAAVLLAEKQERLRKAASEHQLLLENTLRALFLRFPYRTELLTELERRLQDTRLVLFQIADYFPAHKRYTKRDVPLLQFAVLNIINEWLDVYGTAGMLLLIESGRFALFIDPRAEEQALCASASETVERLLGLTLAPHFAGAVASLKRLPDVYESMTMSESKLSAAPADGGNGGGGEPGHPINRARQQLIAAQTAAFIAAGQPEALKQYLNGLMKDICGMRDDGWKIEALSLSFALQDTARKQLEQDHDPQALSERISKLHECRGMDEAGVWMKAETDRFMNAFYDWQNKYSANAVSRAIRFMEEHYAEPLSLQDVATQVHLNATYFSHLFKKETGCSFVNFLIELRMEKAKQLLANTDMNVTEVSGLVGYDLPNYFAKLFKQSTGLTPKEYRKHHQTGKEDRHG